MILTAHGSADPRSSAVTFAVAEQIRAQRPGLDVAVAFCERSEPNLRDVLATLDRPGVVTPLLLASAYHARTDIPAMIAESGTDVLQADTLGEDPRLVDVLRQRLGQLGTRPEDTGVLVVAVGSSHPEANARSASVAQALAGRWASVRVAFATGPQPSVADGIAELRASGARRVVVAPWFIAPGVITDRVAAICAELGEDVWMTDPLGAHPLLAEAVLDRFDEAVSQRLAA